MTARPSPPQHDPRIWPYVDEWVAPIVVQLQDLTAACRLIVTADDEKNLIGLVEAIAAMRRVLEG